MDYKQLDDFLQTYLPDEYYEDIRAKIVPSLQSLLDEQNASLKLELQKQKDEFSNVRTLLNNMNKQLMDDLVKQKELNAELVKTAIDEFIKLDYRSYTLAEIKLVLYALIKKSSEI